MTERGADGGSRGAAEVAVSSVARISSPSARAPTRAADVHAPAPVVPRPSRVAEAVSADPRRGAVAPWRCSHGRPWVVTAYVDGESPPRSNATKNLALMNDHLTAVDATTSEAARRAGG